MRAATGRDTTAVIKQKEVPGTSSGGKSYNGRRHFEIASFGPAIDSRFQLLSYPTRRSQRRRRNEIASLRRGWLRLARPKGRTFDAKMSVVRLCGPQPPPRGGPQLSSRSPQSSARETCPLCHSEEGEARRRIYFASRWQRPTGVVLGGGSRLRRAPPRPPPRSCVSV